MSKNQKLELPKAGALESSCEAEKNDRHRKRIEMILNISKELGFPVGKEMSILDLGCGYGKYVYLLRKMGFNAFGVEIDDDKHPLYKSSWLKILSDLKEEHIVSEESEVIRLVKKGQEYRIPFQDATFDFVYSDQVFEHVRDYERTIFEIFRVLKSGGFSLHIFPSRYRINECHTSIPFATVFRGWKYLRFWAFVGITSESTRGLSWEETARWNFNYLNEQTNYLPKTKLREYFCKAFGDVSFAEGAFVKFHPRIPHYVYETASATRMLPLVSWVVSVFATRVVWVRKDRGLKHASSLANA